MKIHALLIVCTLVAGFSANSFAAMVGSSRPVAQENFQKLIKTNECPSCDLAGVVLTRVDLSGANLEGANLAGAKLNLADLAGANLKNANLQGAKLGGADLAGADLRGANLTGAVLEGAYLKDAQLDGSIILDKPYESEELPDVSEKKYQDDQTRGKNVPYTQDVVIEDRRDLTGASSQEPTDLQVQEEETATAADTTESSATASSKTLVPMADAVVHTPDPEKSVTVEEQTEPAPVKDESAAEAAEDTGIWGSITSFFGGDSQEPGDEATVAEPAEQIVDQPAEEIVVSPVEEVVVIEEVQPETESVAEMVSEEKTLESEEIVIAEVEPVGAPPVVVTVEETVPEPSVTVEEKPEPAPVVDDSAAEAAEDAGIWGSITSFFGGDSQESGDEVAVVEPVDQEPAEQIVDQPAEEIVISRTEEVVVTEEVQPETESIAEMVSEEKILESEETIIVEVESVVASEEPVTAEEEVVVESVEPAAEPSAAELKQDVASEDKEDDSGFWSSVTSIFTSSDDEKEAGQESVEKGSVEVATQVDESVADISVRTGEDELPPDADVRTMIEQIEGVPSEPEVEVVQQEVISETVVEEPAVVEDSDQIVAVDAEKTGLESSGAAVPAAGSTVSDMIEQIEADQVPEPAPQDDMVYSVQTPEQAKFKQQMILERLLDEDRCVACDLAGVDLSGKNLNEVDLERANLQGANLEGINLNEANLKGVNFSDANLKDADLREADLYLADFTGADLTGAKFEEALIDSADFTDAIGANLEGAIKEE